jgi:hypothetical protein
MLQLIGPPEPRSASRFENTTHERPAAVKFLQTKVLPTIDHVIFGWQPYEGTICVKDTSAAISAKLKQGLNFG